MKKALIVVLVVLVVVTGMPVLVVGMGSMDCAQCPPGVLVMATACQAVLLLVAGLLVALLVLAFGAEGRRRGGRNRAAPLQRPPRLA